MLRPIRKGPRWALFIALLSLGALVWTTLPGEVATEYSPKKLSKQERIALAIEQEIEMTKDPALGYVPKSRLFDAYATAEALRAQQASRRGISNVDWEERGPDNVGGRTRAILIDANDPTGETVWAGGVAGGIWKTTSITANPPGWQPINDLFENLAVSAIAQDPSNPQIMYFATGEGWFNGDAVRGLGLWKSIDGGDNWDPLPATRSVGGFTYTQDLVVLDNGDVLAATRGGGIQRSQDGGDTWIRVLSAGIGGGTSNNAADIEIASNGDIYAGFGIFSSGRLYKSTDGGDTWIPLHSNPGFSGGSYERVELAVAPSDPNRVYAMLQDANTNGCQGIYRSDNGGDTWTAVTNPNNGGFAGEQAWYDFIIQVHPQNPDRVFIAGVTMRFSNNGGQTWSTMGNNVHVDHHQMVFDPNDPDVLYLGNDGGIYRSENTTAGTNTPTFIDRNSGYNITQYYACAIGPDPAIEEFLGGTQDNGSQRYTSEGINSTVRVTGGDGAFTHIDEDDREVQITTSQFDTYYFTTNAWATRTVRSFGSNPRFINPSDYDSEENIIYACTGANQILRISNVDTGNPVEETVAVPSMGGRISTVTVSPNTSNRIFVGLDNGRVSRIENANTTPTATQLNFGAFMPNSFISSIAIGPDGDDHLLVTYSNYGVNSVWVTRDGGENWKSVEGNLPDMPVRSALFNPVNGQQAMIATEVGVWSTDSLDATNVEWEPSNNGLANVRTDMLQIRKEDGLVIAATHGRGMYSTDAFTRSTVRFEREEAEVVERGDEIEDAACQGYTTYTVNLTMNRPPREDVLVLVQIDPSSTATIEDFDLEGGLLFDIVRDSFQTFPITFQIKDDGIAEGEEFIKLTASPLNSNAIIVDQEESFTLFINDPHIDPDDAGTVGSVNLVEENFSEGVLPEGWSMESEGSTNTNLYQFGDPTDLSGPSFVIPEHDGNIAVTNDQTCVCPKPDDRLILPELDLSNSVLATLEYDVYFRAFNGETAEIWVSTDQGQNWNTTAIPSAAEWTNRRVFLTDYVGQPSVLIAFVYNDNGGWNYGLALDNVVVTSNFVQRVDVATDLTSDQHELGPNEKVDFYNEAGEVIGSARNLGSNDFGCVSLTIDRAGLGATPFWSEDNRAGDLMDKTFRLEVENPTASRDIELTLYYTATEDSAWRAVTGRDWQDILWVTHPGAISEVTPENQEPFGEGTVQQIGDLQSFQVPESDHLALRGAIFGQTAGYGAGVPEADPIVVYAQEITLTATPVNFTVELDATIDEEMSVVGYVMEKATEDGAWEELSSFAPNNSGAYQVIDDTPDRGLNQYRLRVQYTDETEALAGPVEVYFYGGLADWSLYPNPFTEELNILFPEGETNPVTMILMDAAGRKVWAGEVSPGTPRLQTLPVSNLSTGIYLMKIIFADDTEQMVKLLKR